MISGCSRPSLRQHRQRTASDLKMERKADLEVLRISEMSRHLYESAEASDDCSAYLYYSLAEDNLPFSSSTELLDVVEL